ncbi:MAG: hypothetical protein ABIX28_16490 [Vicinamibacterales bacterium]
MNMRRVGLILLVVALTSGCLRSTTTITVKQDGSGTLDQEIGATPQALAMLRSFDSAGGGDQPANLQMFGPEQAESAAKSMGVRFISGEPIKTGDSEGYRAHFAFDDVTTIKFDMIKTPGPAAEKGGAPPFGFAFAKGDGSSVLTITMPDQQAGGGSLLSQLPGAGQSKDNQQAFAMLMPMLRGLFVDVTLNVEGRVIKSNAPYVTGSQVTLLQFDFDKVNATAGALQKLQTITDPKLLKDIPGVRMVTDPVVTIEFGR